MEKLNIKSIVLGIGIGIVITAFMSIIYLAGSDPKGTLSDEEIIIRAGQLGMVKAEGVEKNDTAQMKQNGESSVSSNDLKTTKIEDEPTEDNP